MNPFGRHIISVIAGLASAYTLVHHILPIEIKYQNGVVLALVIFSSLLFYRLYSHGIRFLQDVRQYPAATRYAYLVIGLLLTGVLTYWLANQSPLEKVDMQITATGQKNISAQGTEVWLKGVYVDGENIDMTSFDVDYHGWEIFKNSWVARHNQPTTLRWQGLAGKEIRLILGKNPSAGQVIVTARGKTYEFDLYGKEDTTQELLVPVDSLVYSTKLAKLVGKLVDFLSASCFVFSFLVAVHAVVNQEQVNTNNYPKQLVYRRWLLRSGGVLVCGSVVILLINYIVDPLQFYHRATYGPYWSKEQRYQNAGLAKNYSYDTVLLGTSTIENYIPAQVDEWLGSKSIKLAISGSSLREQMLTLKLAVDTKRVKHVIWGMDYIALGNLPEQVDTGVGTFPLYFYQTSLLGSLPYLFSNTTTQQSVEIVLDQLHLTPHRTSQLALLNSWQHKAVFGHEGVQKHFKQIKTADFGKNQILRRVYNANTYILKNFKDNVDINIVPLISTQPQVHFDIVLPPYHVLFLTAFYQQNPQTVSDWLTTRQYLAEQLAPYKNVTIHDFQEEEVYILDDSRYKDVLHYDKATSDELIQKIKNNSNVVDQGKMVMNNQHLLKIIQNLAMVN